MAFPTTCALLGNGDLQVEFHITPKAGEEPKNWYLGLECDGPHGDKVLVRAIGKFGLHDVTADMIMAQLNASRDLWSGVYADMRAEKRE